MAVRVNKVIVTNRKALTSKYGTKAKQIETAVKTLIAADQNRNLKTVIIAVDSAATMKKHKGKAVTEPADPKQNKAAIDAIYRSLMPDYLLILGSIDVVPHQDLRNPLYDPSPDGTANAN